MSSAAWARKRALENMSSMDPPAAVAYDRRLIGEALAGSGHRFEALLWIADPSREIDFCAATIKDEVGGGAHGPLLDKLAAAGLVEVIEKTEPVRRRSTRTGKVFVTDERPGAGTFYRAVDHHFWAAIHAFDLPLGRRADRVETIAVGNVVNDLLAMQAEFESEREDEDGFAET